MRRSDKPSSYYPSELFYIAVYYLSNHFYFKEYINGIKRQHRETTPFHLDQISSLSLSIRDLSLSLTHNTDS